MNIGEMIVGDSRLSRPHRSPTLTFHIARSKIPRSVAAAGERTHQISRVSVALARKINLLQVPCRDANDLRPKGATSSAARGPRLRNPGISTFGSAPTRSFRGANCRTSAGTTGILLAGINENRAVSSWAIESLKQKPSIGHGVRMRCGYLYFS